ncbi:MAG: hypothetical protein Q9170_007849 [Blastenia crenularia]
MSVITSEATSSDVNGIQAVTATDYYTSVKTVVKRGDLDEVKSKLSQWRADTSVAGPSQEQIDYLVPQAAGGKGQPEILEYLLSLGGKLGTHAVQLAESSAVFQVFLAHGWQVDNSLLRQYVRHPDLIALFLSHGANPEPSGPHSFSALDIAALHGTLETVKLLMDHGVKIEPTNAALHAAAQGDAPDRIPIMAYLVEQGADINGLAADLTAPSEARQSGRKGTPLHTAFKWACEDAKVWLLEHGADPEAKNELGETPEEWGRRFDNDGPNRGLRLRRAMMRKHKSTRAEAG